MTMTPEMQWLRRAEFLKGCSHLSQLPPADAAVEVAFAGRSNAGKSSVLNRLCDNRRLARVGKAPGRTREINLFSLPRNALPEEAVSDHQQTLLVDLPGYGYARVSRSLALGELLTDYLLAPRRLCGLVLVTDIRRRLGEEDRNLLDICVRQGIVPLLLLNKADKLSQSVRSKALAALGRETDAAAGTALVCSARSGEGMESLAQWVTGRMRSALAGSDAV